MSIDLRLKCEADVNRAQDRLELAQSRNDTKAIAAAGNELESARGALRNAGGPVEDDE